MNPFSSLVRPFIGFFFLIGSMSSLCGALVELPSLPLVKPAPSFAHWQIHFNYDSDNSNSGEEPPKPNLILNLPPSDLVVTRTALVWHSMLTDTGGRTTEIWYDGSTAYMILPGVDKPNPTDPGTLPSMLDHIPPKPDFPDIGWISLKNYVGEERINSIECYVFQDGSNSEKVWINCGTRMPVRWTKGGETRDFTFFSPPTSRLALPYAIKTVARAIKTARDNANRSAVHGN